MYLDNRSKIFVNFLIKLSISSDLSNSVHTIKHKVISMDHNWNYSQGSDNMNDVRTHDFFYLFS